MPKLNQEVTILRVAVPSPLSYLFDYLPPLNHRLKQIKPGMRVLVPFGNRKSIGVVLEVANSSQLAINKLKVAAAILDEEPLLSKKMLEFITWTSNYYHHPLGELFKNVLPTLLRQTKSKKSYASYHQEIKPTHKKTVAAIEPNQHQTQAINTIKKNLTEFKTFLLNGVTGSGKTEVYLQVITAVLALNKQVLVLVPEINLTPQTIARFAERFRVAIAVFHSRLTPKERLLSWLMAKEGTAPIIIGTRSSIFTPFKQLGIIIVDEEHDLSFKQQSGLRYSARDLAVVRGKLETVPVILGSATPSLESIYNVKRQRYIELTLPERAGDAIHPSFHLVDMRSQKLKHGIAENLLQQIKKHLTAKGQILIFLNRRGFAPILICHHCSWVASCEHCDARLTVHHKKQHLRCHHCGVLLPIPTQCPACSREKLLMLGAGTERVEIALRELFPEVTLTRIDRDTTKRKNSLETILQGIHQGEYQILIGTQMLAKGHHFPQVTMVAVLNVDQGLFGFDFRSSEHLAQLIIQVAGRAGRAKMPGAVYLQTHNPHHPLLLDLINDGYAGFVNNCLLERQIAGMPPYSHLALLQAESKKPEKVQEFLLALKGKIVLKPNGSLKIFGPVPTTMERKADYFRAQLLFQSKHRKTLQQAIDDLLNIIDQSQPVSGLRWFFDIDPVELSG